MTTFYDNQAPFDTNGTTSIVAPFDKSKENTSKLKAKCLNDKRIHPLQADVNQRIQRVQENYFLERRSFL